MRSTPEATDMSKQTNSGTMVRAFALAATALMATMTGCADDDYYCDATGCYTCDGVGCRPATPPNRATCRDNTQCGSNQLCTDLGCTTSCANNNDCAQGWVCRGASGTTRGLCVTPREQTPTPVANTCRFSSQCGPNRVCVNQQCRAACTDASMCAAGQVCRDGACAEPTGACMTDTDCGAGRRCVNTSCLARCTTNAECAAGRYCLDGACVVDTRRQPFCTSDAQCTAPSRCLDGVCRRPCSDAQECLRTDVQYQRCEPISYLGTTQRYCQTNNEVTSTCGSARECSANQSCVDGNCRGM